MAFTNNNHQTPDMNNSNIQEFHDCPNCWGYLQWAEKDCMGSVSIDKGSPFEIFSKNGFIRRFVTRYLKGIKK